MEFRAKPLEISEEDPFKNDVMNRKPVIEGLTTLTSKINTPFVMAVNAPWGTGKTTFIEMWQKHLSKEGHPSVYLNAWKTDYSKEPLIAFISELEELSKKLKLKGDKLQKAVNLVKKSGMALIKHAVPAAVKLGTGGILDLGKAIEDTVSTSAEKAAEEFFKSISMEKEAGEKFRENLRIISETVIAKSSESGSPKRFYFFIDELDRCRPDYAVFALERLKHYFNVEGIIFVIAIDKDQLGSSLKAIYGEGLNAREYLRRFIDLEVNLPWDAKSLTKSLMGRFGVNDFFANRMHPELKEEEVLLVRCFEELFQYFKVPPRVQEQCFTRAAIAMAMTKENFKLQPLLLTALIVFREIFPDPYKQFALNDHTANMLMKEIYKSCPKKDFFENRTILIIEAYLALSKTNRAEIGNDLVTYDSVVNSQTASKSDKDRAGEIAKIIRELANQWGGRPSLKSVIEKIEFAHSFT